MRINERCNLVIPLYRDGDEPYAWVHSTPLSNEAFRANYVLLSKTFTAIHSEGLGAVSGPRIAAMALQDIAQRMANDGQSGDDVAAPFLNEMRRLTNIIVAQQTGWDTVPMEEALRRKLLDPDDVDVVEGGLTFFMLGWQLYPRNARQQMMDGAASVWGARMQSLSCTAFAASLRTSTETVSSGETPKDTPPPPARTGATVTITGPDGQSVMSSLPS